MGHNPSLRILYIQLPHWTYTCQNSATAPPQVPLDLPRHNFFQWEPSQVDIPKQHMTACTRGTSYQRYSSPSSLHIPTSCRHPSHWDPLSCTDFSGTLELATEDQFPTLGVNCHKGVVTGQYFQLFMHRHFSLSHQQEREN